MFFLGTLYYVYPNLQNCPNIAFCFLKPIVSSDNNNTNSNLSGNNKNLVNGINNTNSHLQDLKNKTDLTNKKLEDLNNNASNLLSNNKDIKSTLDKISLSSDKSLKTQLDLLNKASSIKSEISNQTNLLQQIADNTLNSNNNLKNISSNTANTNLKLDKVNDNLKSLLDKNLTVDMTSTNDILKKILDKNSTFDMSATNDKLQEILDKDNKTDMTSTNDKLQKLLDKNSTFSMTSTNNILKKILDKNSSNFNLGSLMSSVGNNTDTIRNGLFSDINPFGDGNLTDGSGSFKDLGSTVIDNFDVTESRDIFNLHSASKEIPTKSFVLMGKTFTMLSPDMFSGLPIDDIRNLIMFIFALMGFITVIRTI